MSGFDYEKFIRLSGSDLCRWMEPLLLDRQLRSRMDIVERVLADLPTFQDEYHLVYALELLYLIAPEVVVKQAPKYLAHTYGSVWCAAHNIIMRLPDRLLTPELLEDVKQVASAHPHNKYVQDTYTELRARMN